MAKKNSNTPATWCPYCHAFVVACVHSGGRPPARKPKAEPVAEKKAAKKPRRK